MAVRKLYLILSLLLLSLSYSHIVGQNNIIITNYTNYDVKNIISLIANEMFDSLNAEIYVQYIPQMMLEKSDIYYDGFVLHPKYENINIYQILLRRYMNTSKLKHTLCHEFVHIKQYDDGRLDICTDYAIFEGHKIYFSTVGYLDLEYEIEARYMQNKIYKKVFLK